MAATYEYSRPALTVDAVVFGLDGEDLKVLLIRRALERCSGNRSEAAKTLNINRQLLYAKLKRYGLAENDEGAEAGH